MKIGFDIDGIMTDNDKIQLETAKKYLGKKYNLDIYDKSGKGLKEIYNCSAKEEKKFWTYYTLRKLLKEKPRDGIVETIKKLKEEGNQLYIITSRAETTKKNIKGFIMRFLTKKWLKKNGIEYDDILFCSIENSPIDKRRVCEEKEIEIMVEDTYENILEISKNCNVIAISNNNNTKYDYKNTIMVNSSEKVYNAVQEIKLKKANLEGFKVLDKNTLETYSSLQKIEYYKQLKTYYKSMPFNIKKQLIDEKKYIRIMRVLSTLFKWYYNPKFLGTTNFPKNQGGLLVSNHLHAFDPLLLTQGNFEFPTHLVAKKELTKSPAGLIFNNIGSIFVNRGDKESCKETNLEVIKTILNGGTVMEFPEGTRYHKAKDEDKNRYMSSIGYGTVSRAQKTGQPIYPAAINDNYSFRSKTLFSKMGDPLYVGPLDDLTLAKKKLETKIITLMWELMEEELKVNNHEVYKKYKNINNLK